MRRELEALLQQDPVPNDETTRSLFERALDALEAGTLRAANCVDGEWQVDTLVKRIILLGFKLGEIIDLDEPGQLQFSDKDTYALRPLPVLERQIRIVPGGSSVRRGAYLGERVTMMPPAYVNVGAYVSEGTMVDSHALVGSCAQIGARCHLSAGCQIGGVLEPIGQVPVVIEDDVFIGGNSGVYEGTIVRSGAVLAAGTILTRGTAVYDLVKETIHRATPSRALEIPANAVVVPGSRPASGAFAEKHGLQLYAPIIVKYRDERTGASTTLEEALR